MFVTDPSVEINVCSPKDVERRLAEMDARLRELEEAEHFRETEILERSERGGDW